MSRWYFVPEDWEMSESLRQWTYKKGLSDKQIEEELESFRDHQYKRPMMRPDTCWRNWVRPSIRRPGTCGVEWSSCPSASPA